MRIPAFTIQEHAITVNADGTSTVGTGTVEDGGIGASLVFYGMVRNTGPQGSGVIAIEYDCYPELAQQEGECILREAQERYRLYSVGCVHRVGRVILSQASIRVELSAAHRREVFEACMYIMDQIKQRLPIWKKECFGNKPEESRWQ